MSDKSEKYGYVKSVLKTLRPSEHRKFAIDDVNVQSWRSIVSKVNRKIGYKKYSVTVNRPLGFMAVKNNDNFKAVAFIKSRKADHKIHAMAAEMIDMAEQLDIVITDVIVDESANDDIDRAVEQK